MLLSPAHYIAKQKVLLLNRKCQSPFSKSHVDKHVYLQSRSVSPSFYSSSSRGFSPFVAASLLILALLLGKWLLGLLKMVRWGGTGRKRGRYVRDRGLGGKEVSLLILATLAADPATHNDGCVQHRLWLEQMLQQSAMGWGMCQRLDRCPCAACMQDCQSLCGHRSSSKRMTRQGSSGTPALRAASLLLHLSQVTLNGL